MNEALKLAQKHWLVFEHSSVYGRMVVVGCHCGFEADVDQDSGWGDSVVLHLLEVGTNAAQEEG